MEFNIRPVRDDLDAGVIEAALQMIDPASIVDRDPTTGAMRVSTVALEIELRQIFAEAGHALPFDAIERVPSVCCGGCSG